MRIVIEALAALGGVASTSSLQQAWVSRRSIEAGVRAAAVQRVSRGVYALPNSDPYEMLLGGPQEFVRLVRQALAMYRSAQ
jgi:hypothetical protein